MAISDSARRNHDELFPGRVSTLAQTDPELLECFVAANLNVGNDRARLLDVLTQLIPFIGYPRTLNTLRLLDEIAPA